MHSVNVRILLALALEKILLRLEKVHFIIAVGSVEI